MHTDRKIGFAMGILLIGVVAALFFRNEPLLPTKVAVPRRERELNDRLRERDVAVYLNDAKPESSDAGAESDEQPWTLRDVLRRMDERNKSLPSPVVSSNKRSAAPPDGRPEGSLDGFRRVKNSPAAVVRSEGSDTATTASEPAQESTALPQLFAPPETESGVTVEVLSGGSEEFQIPQHFEEYVVRYGDTLSGIAQKMLGSQAKYQEIFGANRDRMATPDRLEVGKPIRIPRIAGAPPTSL